MPPKEKDGGKPEGGNVKVMARIRPTNQLEIRRGGVEAVKAVSPTEVEVDAEDGTYKYTFDRIFGPNSTQQEVFDFCAAPIVDDVLQGYNATIFAYGQTSSGKTFTMEGPDITDTTMRGVIPRSVSGLFGGVARADANIEFTVKVAYIEIYLERIRDLLDRFRTKMNLGVREDPRLGVYVAGVTEEYVTCEEELLTVMQRGSMNRATAATGMNEGSSRSHSVFMVTVSQRNLETAHQRSGRLFLVDLAGSEMVRKTNATGQQLEEAKTINKSLSALGLVINALTEDNSNKHIPYRDSKLTRVLQDSLGGNAKTALLINVSPSSYNANETLSTLRFGSRAKRITNKPKINEQRSVEELQLLLQKAENAIDMQQSYIMALEGQLNNTGQTDSGGDRGDSAHTPDMASVAGGGGGGGGGLAGASAAEQPPALSQQIVGLQQKMAGLAAELGEEREEARRAEAETAKLRALLRDKEALLAEASALLAASEQHCESLRQRADAGEAAAARHSDDAGASSSALQAATERWGFERSELELKLGTANASVAKLQAEMDAKDAVDARSAASASASAAAASASSSGKGPAAAAAAAATQADAMRLDAATVSAIASRLGLSADAEAFLAEREAAWAHFASNAQRNHTRADDMAKSGGESVRELEAEKRRLTRDLQSAAERSMELEMQVNMLRQGATQGATQGGRGGQDDGDAASQLAAAQALKDRTAARMQKKFESLQQRLEQLVAVHRQLLRKYAALELDSSEDKKKIALRDERIAQLEANTRTLAMNMRTQAARHVVELTKLREQVSSVRAEQMEARTEQATFLSHAAANAAHLASTRTVGVIRGGSVTSGSEPVRAIRGGGGGPFATTPSSPMAPAS